MIKVVWLYRKIPCGIYIFTINFFTINPPSFFPALGQLSNQPLCSTIVVTNFPLCTTVLNISGTGCSSNVPSSWPGKLILIALHLAVVISAFRLSFERKICPESVESIWIIGAEPVTWIWKEEELVTETAETTDWTRMEVFKLLTTYPNY